MKKRRNLHNNGKSILAMFCQLKNFLMLLSLDDFLNFLSVSCFVPKNCRVCHLHRGGGRGIEAEKKGDRGECNSVSFSFSLPFHVLNKILYFFRNPLLMERLFKQITKISIVDCFPPFLFHFCPLYPQCLAPNVLFQFTNTCNFVGTAFWFLLK